MKIIKKCSKCYKKNVELFKGFPIPQELYFWYTTPSKEFKWQKNRKNINFVFLHVFLVIFQKEISKYHEKSLFFHDFSKVSNFDIRKKTWTKSKILFLRFFCHLNSFKGYVYQKSTSWGIGNPLNNSTFFCYTFEHFLMIFIGFWCRICEFLMIFRLFSDFMVL